MSSLGPPARAPFPAPSLGPPVLPILAPESAGAGTVGAAEHRPESRPLFYGRVVVGGAFAILVYDRLGSYALAWWLSAAFNVLALALLAFTHPPTALPRPTVGRP